jgi:hypothetical protein
MENYISVLEQLVNGINLRKAADAVQDIDRKINFNTLKDRDIIWCKTDFLQELYQGIQNHTNRYVLITHCSDREISKDDFLQKPNCIVKWFAQNVDYNHPDLIPVPIGIENHEGTNKGNASNFLCLANNAFDFKVKNKIINKLFCNFNPRTNPNRVNVANILTEQNLANFVYPLPFDQYVDTAKKFLFIASPKGNGIDCHRTWESLYYGCIPIVERHFMYDSYQHLPIVQIDNWNSLTLDTLTPYIIKYKNNEIFFNTEELTINFWIKKIKQASVLL